MKGIEYFTHQVNIFSTVYLQSKFSLLSVVSMDTGGKLGKETAYKSDEKQFNTQYFFIIKVLHRHAITPVVGSVTKYINTLKLKHTYIHTHTAVVT